MQITRHKMKGFDPRFTDLPDYILKCTAQIWEGRDIAALDWHYGEDLVVRTPAGISRGNAAGKVNTMATLSEFPDRQLLGEDVIWCGDDQSGFLSSHRILSTATHKGGAFGAATGRQVTFRSIADTFSRENRVWDEWLIRDNAAIAVQLGQTAKEAAQAVIDSGDLTRPLTPDSDVVGPYSGTGNDNGTLGYCSESWPPIWLPSPANMTGLVTLLCPVVTRRMAPLRHMNSGWGCAALCPRPRSALSTRSAASIRCLVRAAPSAGH
jgi:hypothetical protein